jgi:flagellar motor component MotA
VVVAVIVVVGVAVGAGMLLVVRHALSWLVVLDARVQAVFVWWCLVVVVVVRSAAAAVLLEAQSLDTRQVFLRELNVSAATTATSSSSSGSGRRLLE